MLLKCNAAPLRDCRSGGEYGDTLQTCMALRPSALIVPSVLDLKSSEERPVSRGSEMINHRQRR